MEETSSRRRRTRYRAFIILVKKFIAFLFSHVGLCALVISYTMLGAVIFRSIEAPHERSIHDHVRGIRRKATVEMWKATYRYTVHLDNWTVVATREVEEYKQVLMKVIRRGYDANDEQENTQWTFAGAFLYSLTVITTIGYGNIACQTYFGRAMTIMFAILGIPLMLLFLTNVGDVLAKLFRGLYRKSVRLKLRLQVWNKRRKARKIRRANSVMTAKALKQMQRRTLLAQQLGQPLPSPRSPFAPGPGQHRSRVNIKMDKRNTQKLSSISQPYGGIGSGSSQSGSLQIQLQLQQFERHHSTGSGGSYKAVRTSPRSLGAPNHLPLQQGQDTQESYPLQPSPSPIQATTAAIEQLALEQMRLETLAQRYEMEEFSLRESTEDKLSKIVVPLWIVFTTMLAYLMGGAIMFTVWEDWGIFDSFYFCYVSLATVGFGDLFPNKSLKDASSQQEKLTITSLYLLFGMALIAMAFNLAQEQVVNIITRLADKLGLLQSASEATDSVCETVS